MTTTAHILEQIRSLGYAVSVHRMGDYIEMHAVLIKDPDHQHIARVIGGDSADEQHQCACVLAEMVGITLDDG